MSEQPKHCPFCPSKDLEVVEFDCEDREGTPTRVECHGCGAKGPWEYERDGSMNCVAAWNRRTHGPETEAAIDQLIELLINPSHGAGFGENICAVAIPDRAAFLREQGVK